VIPETAPEAEPSLPAEENAAVAPAPRSTSTEDAFAALELVRGILEGLAYDNSHLTGTVEELSSELDEVYAKDEAPAAPVPAHTNGAELTRLRAQVAALMLEKGEILRDSRRITAEANGLAAEILTLQRKIERLQDDVRTERERANRARQLARSAGDPDDGAVLFTDPVEQFRHEGPRVGIPYPGLVQS
jgi:chromosome segregation ATPase